MSLENKKEMFKKAQISLLANTTYHFFENDADLDGDFFNKLSNEYKLVKMN